MSNSRTPTIAAPELPLPGITTSNVCTCGALAPIALPSALAAPYIGLAPQTLAKWRSQGEGPPSIKLRSKVVYRIDALNDYLLSLQTGGGRR